MLKRKIERELAQFKAVKPKSAILLTGARQVGKTFIVREFAKGNYRCFLEINFIKQPDAKSLFDNTLIPDFCTQGWRGGFSGQAWRSRGADRG